MPKKPKDISYLESLPIVADFLKKDTPLAPKRIRRYLLDLAVVYPYIIDKCKTFEVFIDMDANAKAYLFNNFIDREFDKRMKAKPNRDRVNCKNRVLHIIWNIQGLLKFLSADRDLRANHHFIEAQMDNTNFINPLTMLDVYDAYEEMPGIGRKRLKFGLFSTWNPVDQTNLFLSDFKRIKTEYGDFWYIHKYRRKSIKQYVTFINVYDDDFVFEYERFCQRYDIKENDPIFSKTNKSFKRKARRVKITPGAFYAYYKYWINKSKLSPYVIPKYIRPLGITNLEPVFRDDKDLLQIWSQHKQEVLNRHYVKNIIFRMVERYPQIKAANYIGSVSRMQVEIRQLKDDIHNKLDIHDQEIMNLKIKQSPAANEKAEEIAEEIATLVREKLKL
jgi:hypothetical protein